MDHALAALLAGRDPGSRRELVRTAAAMEQAYAGVCENAPDGLSNDEAEYAKLFFTLRSPGKTPASILPPRRELARVLASLEYRFFRTTCPRGSAWDTLYCEPGPAFDISLPGSFYGTADEEAYTSGFVEGCLGRIAAQSPEEANFLRDSRGGGRGSSEVLLGPLKKDREVRLDRSGDVP